MHILVPPLGTEPVTPVVEEHSLNHLTAREVPQMLVNKATRERKGKQMTSHFMAAHTL